MPTSVRLDPETEALLNRMARSSDRTKSEVIRKALHRMSEETLGTAETSGLYRTIEDLVGIAEDGPENLAREHKKRFREKLGRNRK